jgi:hypothetical protein
MKNRPNWGNWNTAVLTFAYPENLGTAGWAGTLYRRALVFQRNRLRIFNLYFLAAFHTICLGHLGTSLYVLSSQNNKHIRVCQ